MRRNFPKSGQKRRFQRVGAGCRETGIIGLIVGPPQGFFVSFQLAAVGGNFAASWQEKKSSR
jgi:hypothetical protein